MVTLWSGLWIHVLNVFGVIKPSNQHQAPSYPRIDVFSSAKTIFSGTIPIKETIECICKLKLNTAEGKLRLRRGGWHERDRSLIFMQGKARPAQGGGREISAISSPAFVILPSVGDYFDSRHKGPLPCWHIRTSENCHHTKVLFDWSVRIKYCLGLEARSSKLHFLQRASCRFVIAKNDSILDMYH